MNKKKTLEKYLANHSHISGVLVPDTSFKVGLNVMWLSTAFRYYDPLCMLLVVEFKTDSSYVRRLAISSVGIPNIKTIVENQLKKNIVYTTKFYAKKTE